MANADAGECSGAAHKKYFTISTSLGEPAERIVLLLVDLHPALSVSYNIQWLRIFENVSKERT